MKISASRFRRNGKSMLLLMALFICSAGSLSAQDCDAIVLPKFKNDLQRFNQYPADKVLYYCAFSQFSFEVSDTLQAGVPVHDINEVRDLFTGEPMDRDVQIDLNVLSYYRYDFNRFQSIHAEGPIYFRTAGSEHSYLVLVPMRLAQQRAVDKMSQMGN